MRFSLIVALFLVLPLAANSQPAKNSHASPYAGEESRSIKSLSGKDIAELRRGGGWGLAKAGELNGVPGPAHLLELKDEIPLNKKQVAAIRAIYKAMKGQAIFEGEKLIALEKKLDDEFRKRTINDKTLGQLLADIAGSRSKLRYIHLSTHLKTPTLLTELQITRYNALRGYGENPCGNVPKGHDAAKWREHNQCN